MNGIDGREERRARICVVKGLREKWSIISRPQKIQDPGKSTGAYNRRAERQRERMARAKKDLNPDVDEPRRWFVTFDCQEVGGFGCFVVERRER